MSLDTELQKFTGTPQWKDGTPQSRREGVRKFVVEAKALGVPDAELHPLADRLYEEAGSLGAMGWTKQAVVEGLKSIPAGAAALGGAATDAIGITDTGSGARLKEGLYTAGDALIQRGKQLAPGDEQEKRDKVFEFLKDDLDNGAYPPGLLDYLTGADTPEAAKGKDYFSQWQDLALRSAIAADTGRDTVPQLFGDQAGYGRSLYSPQAKELLADYLATRDPGSWAALQRLGTETSTQWNNRLKQESNPLDPRTMRADIAREGREPSLMEDLAFRSGEFQTSPIDFGLSLFPLLKGAQALNAARAGNTAGAIRNTVQAAAGEFASGAASSALEDPRNTAGQIAESGAQEAVGGAAVAGGMGAVGRVLNLFRRPAPTEAAAVPPSPGKPSSSPVAASAETGAPAIPLSPEPAPAAGPAAAPAGIESGVESVPAGPPLPEEAPARAAVEPAPERQPTLLRGLADLAGLTEEAPLSAQPADAGLESVTPVESLNGLTPADGGTVNSGVLPETAENILPEPAPETTSPAPGDQPKRGADASVATPAEIAMEAARDWDRANKNNRADEWFDGASVSEKSRKGWSEAMANGGNALSAHGMAKHNTLSGALDALIKLMTSGIEQRSKDENGVVFGALHTAPLVAPSGGSTGTTASGGAYTEGPFVLVAKEGRDFDTRDGNISEVLGAVLVNEANADIVLQIRAALQAVMPSIIVESYANAGKVAKALLQPAPETTTPGTPATPPVPDAAPTVEAQMQQARRAESTRAAVLFTPGTPLPGQRPRGLEQATTPHGLVWFNPKKTTREAVAEAGKGQTFDGALLGLSGQTVTAGDTAVTASLPGAPNVQAELVSTPEQLPAAIAAAEAAAPGATVEVKPAAQVLDERAAAATVETAADAQPTPSPVVPEPAQAGQPSAGSRKVVTPAPAPADDFGDTGAPERVEFLERQTDESITAEREQQAAREKQDAARRRMQELRDAPLTGNDETGQGALFASDADLFSGPAAEDMLKTGKSDTIIAEYKKAVDQKWAALREAVRKGFARTLTTQSSGIGTVSFKEWELTVPLSTKHPVIERLYQAQNKEELAYSEYLAATRQQDPFSKGASKPTGTPGARAPKPQQAAAALDLLRRNNPAIADKVRLVQSTDLSPDDYHPDDWAALLQYKPEGYYNRRTGETTIITDHVQPRTGETAVQAVARVVLHERVGHAGLSLLLQDAAFRRRWDKLVAAIPESELAEARALYPEYASPDMRDRLVEEWLARRAESAPTAPAGSALRQLWDAIKDWLRRAYEGLTKQPDYNAEARRILQLSLRALAQDSRATPPAGLAYSRPPAPGALDESAVPEGFGINRYGLRLQADERLRESWRAAFAPALYQKFTEEQLSRDVAAWIGQQGGVEGAAALFLDDASGLKDYERNALGQQLAIALDQRARRQQAAGNTAALEETETLLDSTVTRLESLATQAGQALRSFGIWVRFSPRGVVRAAERKAAAAREEDLATDFPGSPPSEIVRTVEREAAQAAQETAEEADEIVKLWRMMQGEGNTRRGSAIARALKAFMPTGPRRPGAEMDAQARKALADFRREMQERGGAGLARQFWQLMAPPKPAPGALSAFDSATQNMLADLLKQAVQRAGLIPAGAGSNQPDALAKLALNLSNDALRWEKVEQAEAAVQQEIAAITDPARRAAVQAAWEDATAGMKFAIGGPSLMKRALRDALKDIKPEWRKLFDTGRPMQEAAAGVKAEAVARVMDGVRRNMTDPSERTSVETAQIFGALLPALEQEVAAAFDEIAVHQYGAWLEYRAAQARMERERQARKDMLAALKRRGVAENALARLAKAMSDTPDYTKPAQPNDIAQLIAAHTKAPVPRFLELMAGLGVTADVAVPLDKAIGLHRQRAALEAQERALARAIAALKPAPKVQSKVPGFVRKLLDAVKDGHLERAAFLDAYAQAFDKPRFTADFAAAIRAQVERVQSMPEESWLRNREQSRLMAMLARHEGIPTGALWASFWYANILSGLGTQTVNIAGSAVHLLLKTVNIALTSHPQHTVNFVRGLLAGAKQGARQAKAAFFNGEPVMRGDEQWQRMDVLEMLWDDRPATWGRQLARYGAASWGRYVFRTLTAADAFFWNTAKEGQAFLDISRAMERGADITTAAGLSAPDWASAQAQAAAELTTATGTASTRDIDRRAYEIVEARRGADITGPARRFGARITYNYEPEGFMGAVAGAINHFQQSLQNKKGFAPALMRGLARSVVPFVRIVANITDVNLDYTPVGFLRAAKGKHLLAGKDERFSADERRDRLVSASIGLLAGSLLYTMAASHADDDDESVPFMIYGRGPRDPGRRSQMPRNWKPFSLKIGSAYVSFEGTPLAFLFGTLGTALDQQRYSSKRDASEAHNKALALLTAGPRTLMNSGVLSSLNQTFEMLNGDRKPGAWAERTAASFIPAASLLKDIAVAIDPVQVDSTKFGATFLSYLPVLRGEAQPLLNVFGEPVKAPGPWIIQRLITWQDKDDPDATFLARNGLRVSALDAEIAVGTWLTQRDKPHSAGGLQSDRRFRAEILDRLSNGYLTPEERTTLLRNTGPQIRQVVAVMRQQAERGRKPDQSDLNNAISRIRRRAMLDLIK